MEQKSSKYDYSTGSPEDKVKIQILWLHPKLFFFNLFIIKMLTGDSLAAQWLSCASIAGDMGWIRGWETTISHATGYGQKFFP